MILESTYGDVAQVTRFPAGVGYVRTWSVVTEEIPGPSARPVLRRPGFVGRAIRRDEMERTILRPGTSTRVVRSPTG